MTKEENYEIMHKALHSCTEEGTERVAVVVMIDTATQDVKVYGLNIDGEHIPQMLVDVAEEIYDKNVHQFMNRTFN
jgi:hypothetical protein